MKIRMLTFLFFLFLCSISLAQTERIIDFHSDIMINPDASMVVSETIKVESTGDEIKRGIYRDFPTKYGKHKVGFEIVEVLRDGSPDGYHTEDLINGIRIYIGRKSYYLDPGIYTYKITYKTTRQLGFFKDYDELYWNVTGNGWDFQIDRASAKVTLPTGASILNTYAYTGYQGDKGTDFLVSIDDGKAYFKTTVPLLSRQGLTVAVAWPKGFVPEPTRQEKTASFIKDNLNFIVGIIGLIIVLLYYIIVWNKVGRDPKKGVIIPFFGPPKDISPAAMRFIARMGFDQKCFVAAIVEMAVKKYLTIEEEKGKYALKRSDAPDISVLSGDEKIIAEKLITPYGRVELDNANHLEINDTITSFSDLLKKAYEKVYFFSNTYFLIPGIILVIAAFIFGIYGGILEEDFFIIIALILFVFVVTVINFLFYHLLKAPTLLGRQLMDQIEGFKLYLSVAGKDRLNFFNQPGKSPDLFEKFLPYAIALDVENQWAEQFTDIFKKAAAEGREYSPAWYHGANFHALGAVGLASSLGSSFSSAVSSASTPPGSSSGSGGGGSSGGGGGGGGGGGW